MDTPDKVIVTLIGLTVTLFIAWFFWFGKRTGVKAQVASNGYQETLVLVKGGYTPDIIVVERGKPVRLNFLRSESAACSEMVIFPDFGQSTYLPEGKTVAIELMPDRAGEYNFQCQMGMLRGKLVVE
jgi:plastocyanin domain-containing protein